MTASNCRRQLDGSESAHAPWLMVRSRSRSALLPEGGPADATAFFPQQHKTGVSSRLCRNQVLIRLPDSQSEVPKNAIKMARFRASAGEQAFRVLNYLLLFGLALITLYPFWCLIQASLSHPVYRERLFWPQGFYYVNYWTVVNANGIGRACLSRRHTHRYHTVGQNGAPAAHVLDTPVPWTKTRATLAVLIAISTRCPTLRTALRVPQGTV